MKHMVFAHRKIVIILIPLSLVLALGTLALAANRQKKLATPQTLAETTNFTSTTPTNTPTPTNSPTPTATPTPSPAPTPTPAGPCVNLPVLMYHHVQQYDIAKAGGYTGLTVTPEMMQKQLAYLKDKGYTSIDPAQLNAFFDSGASLPKKAVMFTFDDGYDDFATYAAPLLSQYGFRAAMFLPTGLMENPGYLKWSAITSLSGQGFYFGDHTWSHKSMGNNLETDKKEINTAETQLKDHSLDANKVFAYPYGTISGAAIGYLRDAGFTLAFTTVPGRLLCKGNRLTLPRIRVGNSSLAAYGL